MKRIIAWLCIMFLPPLISIFMAENHMVTYGMALDVLTIAFCAFVIVSAIPIWNSWRNMNALPLSPNQFSDFVMQPVFLKYNNLKAPYPPTKTIVSVMLRAVVVAIPSIACAFLLHRIDVSNGWRQLQREFSVQNIAVIENQNSIAIHKTPQRIQEFVNDIHRANLISAKSGVFTLFTPKYFYVIGNDNYKAILFEVNRDTFIIANAGDAILHSTMYTFHSDSLNDLIHQMTAPNN